MSLIWHPSWMPRLGNLHKSLFENDNQLFGRSLSQNFASLKTPTFLPHQAIDNEFSQGFATVLAACQRLDMVWAPRKEPVWNHMDGCQAEWNVDGFNPFGSQFP